MGKIGVTTENIFPVIKKFLYSDQEIFLREIVSNAVDATQKLKTLARNGEYNGDTTDLCISVKLDEQEKTITVSDNGIGMTAEELDKYINQIAFSGVTDFLEKYKDNANTIIGHFGLGFYSAFMVSSKVEIITKSYQAKNDDAIVWSCEGNPEFTLSTTTRSSHGTDIVMHIDGEQQEFLKKERLDSLLKKYCRFMTVPIIFGKKQEWKDGKMQDTEENNIINSLEPIWTASPSSLKDADYIKFYKELYPMHDEPLFWIHLNVDYPFNLTGVLYFPHVSSNIELQKGKVNLYCNQVFVTDQVDGIVPEFLTLLHGVIDSPDIPLNVSRSYLQGDANVKKISKYITKKVADRLYSLFKENREDFEKKWDNLKLFINYGMLSQEDFYTKAKDFALLKTVEGTYFTYNETLELIKERQTDKDGYVVYLYATDKETQYSYIKSVRDKGYEVLLFDGELDAPLLSMLEQKLDKSRFVRVDSDVADKLIQKEDSEKKENLSEEEKKQLTDIFTAQIPKIENMQFTTSFETLGKDSLPVMLTMNEYMRRMKEISKYQPGMAFYAQMPDSYQLVVNTSHPLIATIMSDIKNDGENVDSRIQRLIGLALLQCGLLKGEQLNDFIAECLKHI